MEIRTISLEQLDLSLMEMRIMNPSQAMKIERSMKAYGQLQPVVVRQAEGYYQLIDGFKRFYAAEILLISTLQCLVLDVSLAQTKILLMNYNRGNRAMIFWEEAMILQDLRSNHEMDQKQLASLTDRSRSWVSRRLSMIERIDPEVAIEIRMGELSGCYGRALMKLPRDKQGPVAQTILRYRLSTRQSDQVVQAWLDAQDEQQREEILEHPMMIISDQWEEQSGYSYDDRLSSFGNELEFYIREVIMNIGGAIRILSDRRIGDYPNLIICGREAGASQSPGE